MELCTFCYKSTSDAQHNNVKEIKELCSTFYRNLQRFIRDKSTPPNLQFEIVCCRDCKFLIKEFCEVYHRIKCLELQLQWKLNSLTKVMKLADRVPSRVKLAKQCFVHLGNETELYSVNKIRTQPEGANVIDSTTYEIFKNFRENIINKCQRGQHTSLVQPRILLYKLNKDDMRKRHSRVEIFGGPASPTNEERGEAHFDTDSVCDENAKIKGFEENSEETTRSLAYESDNDKGDHEIGPPLSLKHEPSIFDNQEYENSICSSASSHDEPEDKPEVILATDINSEPKNTTGCLKKPITFQCKFCSVKCTSERFLKSHIKWRHYRLREKKNTQTFRFRCSVCKTFYQTYQSLRRHKFSAIHRVLEKRLAKGSNFTKDSNYDLNSTAIEQLPDTVYTNLSKNVTLVQENDKTQESAETLREGDVPKQYNLRRNRKSYVSNDEHLNSDSDEDYSPNIDSSCTSSSEECLRLPVDLETNKYLPDSSTKNAIEEKSSESQKWYRCFLDNCKFKRAVFYSLSSFNHHKKFHIRGQYRCKFCEKVEKTIIDLSLHETEMHSAIPSTSTSTRNIDMFYCARCPFKNHKEGVYVNHFAQTHLGMNPPKTRKTLWECEICKRKFARGKNCIKIHFKTHHDTSGLVDPDKHIEKCSEIGCSAYFLSKDQLLVHGNLLHSSFKTNQLEYVDNFIKKCWEMDFLRCLLCKKKYRSLCKFRKHIKVFHSESTLKPHDKDFDQLVKGNGIVCPIIECTKTFQTLKGLEIHKNLHGTFPCIFCDEVLDYAPDLAIHEQQVHSISIKTEGKKQKISQLKCSRCDLLYKEQRSYKRHFVNEHLVISTVVLICPICKFECHHESLTQHHLNQHYTDGMDSSLIQRCDQCSAYFRTKLLLGVHRNKVHKKILPLVSYKCNHCPKSFKFQLHLDRHLDKMHPETEISSQFRCSKCKRLFVSEIGLKGHITKYHSNKSKKRLNPELYELCVVDRCKRRFPDKKSLECHQKIHKRGNFKCNFCDVVLNTILKLIQHETINHSNTSEDKKEKAVQCCSRCSYQTKFFTTLQTHFAKHHLKISLTSKSNLNENLLGKFKCEFCNVDFVSASDLAYHEAEHVNSSTNPEVSAINKIQCPRCPKSYKKMFYIKHFLKVHFNGLTKDKQTVCSICQNKTTKPKRHFVKYHDTEKLEDPSNIYKCQGEDDACKAYFLQYAHLIHHKRKIHGQLDDLNCKICKKRYTTKKSLQIHFYVAHKELLENPDLPFACDVVNCKRRFDTKEELQHHKKFSRHKNSSCNSDSDKIICEKCNKNFPSKYHLRSHMHSVHSSKLFICPKCGKSFKTKNSLDNHLESHKGPDAWKFQCSVCGKKSLSKYSLATHMRTHTGEKPYICQFCGLKYSQQRDWRNHILSKHKDQKDLPTKRVIKTPNQHSRKGIKKGECVYARVKP